ncbi:MAG TPA: hypothetical protein VKX46_15960, partial [Ktedonobacteraceae bacterium]|nr:hypothetical protein [Ktedonobacteraceae bacterium]
AWPAAGTRWPGLWVGGLWAGGLWVAWPLAGGQAGPPCGWLAWHPFAGGLPGARTGFSERFWDHRLPVACLSRCL